MNTTKLNIQAEKPEENHKCIKKIQDFYRIGN